MKKRMFLLIVLIMMFMFVPSVFAANITGCETALPGVDIDVKIANAVYTIILAIQIAVPVILVIFGMLDLLKAMTSAKEDEIKKGQQILVKRTITAVLIFFIIAVVKVIVGLAAGSESTKIMDCASCFLNGASETDGSCK